MRHCRNSKLLEMSNFHEKMDNTVSENYANSAVKLYKMADPDGRIE